MGDRTFGDLGHLGAERDDAVDRLVGLQLGLDDRLRGRQVVVVDLDVGHRAAEGVLDAGAALFEADVARLLDHAEDVVHSFGLELCAHCLSGDLLVGAEV